MPITISGERTILEVPSPPIGRDVADYFLFDLRMGYCDYYATAMVVLARAAGLPARFVSGYASGAYDSSNAQYFVTEANAHSWVEIFFTDIGWVEFEPTAGLPAFDRQDEPFFQRTDEFPLDQNEKSTGSGLNNILLDFFWKLGMGILLLGFDGFNYHAVARIGYVITPTRTAQPYTDLQKNEKTWQQPDTWPRPAVG